MLTIQIKNGDNKVVAVINNIYNLTVDDEVNKGGKLKLRFPTEKRLQEKPIKKGYRISIAYWYKINEVVRLFEWYITDITIKSTEVQIEADNWLSYLQWRIIRDTKNYENTPIKTVISQIYNELNSNFTLPIVLDTNDCDTPITKQFDAWTSFYDIIKYCYEAEPKLIARIYNDNGKNILQVSKNPGEILDGVREFDVNYTRGTNIVDWSYKDTMDDFYSYMKNAEGQIANNEFNNETKLIFEKYEEEGALALPTGEPLPSIAVSRDTDRWSFNIWDRKNIRLVTGYDWLPLEYLGLIQSRKVTIAPNTWIKAEIKISEDYKPDTNILDLMLQNLRKK